MSCVIIKLVKLLFSPLWNRRRKNMSTFPRLLGDWQKMKKALHGVFLVLCKHAKWEGLMRWWFLGFTFGSAEEVHLVTNRRGWWYSCRTRQSSWGWHKVGALTAKWFILLVCLLSSSVHIFPSGIKLHLAVMMLSESLPGSTPGRVKTPQCTLLFRS